MLLVAAVAGPLWLPAYNHSSPALGGFPFFYWYQLIWVPAVAVFSAIAYVLASRAQRATAGSAGAPVPETPESQPPDNPPSSTGTV